MIKIFTFIIFFAASFTLLTAQNQIISFSNKQKSDVALLEPQIQLLSSNSYQSKLLHQYSNAILKPATNVKGNYQYINIKGLGFLKEYGNPSVPFKNELFGIGYDESIAITINRVAYIEYENINLIPVQYPLSDAVGAKQPDFIINEQTYSTNAFYPSQVVKADGLMKVRGENIAKVRVCPVQYNPVTKVLRVYSLIEYTIEHTPVNQLFSKSSQNYCNLMQNLIVNGQSFKSSKPKSANSGDGYLILAPQAFQLAADTLAKWRRQQGYNVEVILKANWTSADIKYEIKDRYDKTPIKPDYFVLIGDHDGDYPMPAIEKELSGERFLTDLYYACFDGDNDFHPDMAHGRISVRSPKEALSVVQKIVNYERSPVADSSFYNKGVNCAYFQDEDYAPGGDGYASRRFCHTSEEIRDYLVNEQGYDIERIYWTDPETNPTNYNNGEYSNGEPIPDELLRENGFEWNGNSSDITNSINQGRFFIFHRDHGYLDGTGWGSPEYLSWHIGNLKNGAKTPIVFSINCATGAFDNESCFAETFLRHKNGGAVGVFAATKASQSGQNDAMAIGMFDAIWSSPGLNGVFGTGGIKNVEGDTHGDILTMGHVLNQGLFRMSETWLDDEETYAIFLWFGDPATKIWTQNPHDNSFVVEHENQINEPSGKFLINTKNKGVATLMQDGQVIGRAEIDSDNNMIPYAILNHNQVTLTITATNFHPYQTKISISDDCDILPYIKTLSAQDLFGGTVKLKAKTDSEYLDMITSVGFNISSNPYHNLKDDFEMSFEIASGSESEFEVLIENLETNTVYFYNTWCITEQGLVYGQKSSFTSNCLLINKLPYASNMDSTSYPCLFLDYKFGGSNWSFENPLERNFKSTSSKDGFIAFENIDPVNNKEAEFILPPFNFSAYKSVNLSFEHLYWGGTWSEAGVYYSINNNEWKKLVSWGDQDIGTMDRPGKFSRDITNELAGVSNARIKFVFKSGKAECWLIDDVLISGQEHEGIWLAIEEVHTEDNSVLSCISNPDSIEIKETGLLISEYDDVDLKAIDVIVLKTTNPIQRGKFTQQYANLIAGADYFAKSYLLTATDTFYSNSNYFIPICEAVNLPYYEGFEQISKLPNCYVQTYIADEQDWQVGTGNGLLHPKEAYSGEQNIYFKSAKGSYNQSRIELPTMNLKDYNLVNLSFMLSTNSKEEPADILKLAVKSPEADYWKDISYIDSVTNGWQKISVDLPNLQNNYQIAFEGIVQYGYGLCIDDIAVQPLFNIEFNITRNSTPLSNISVQVNNLLDSTNYDGQVQYSRLSAGWYYYTIEANGFYTLSDSVEVIDSDQLIDIELTPTAVNSTNAKYIKVYPNPTQSELYVDFIDLLSGKLSVYTITGEEVKQISFKNRNRLHIDTSDLPKGLYMLIVSSDTLNYSKQIIIVD